MVGTKVGDMLLGLSLDPNLGSFSAGAAATAQISAQIRKLAVASEMAKHDVIDLGRQLGLLTPEVAANLKARVAEAAAKKQAAEEEKKAAGAQKDADKAKAATARAVATIGLPSHAKAARAIKSDWQKIAASGSGAASAFWRLAAAATAYFSVTRTAQTIQGVLDIGGALDDTAQKTGFSAEAVQKWGHSAKLGGTDGATLNAALLTLGKGLKTVATGKGPAAEAFKALGISLNDPAIKAKDLNAIMFLVADRLVTLPDGAKKATAAMGLFGQAGANLIPTLNSGVAGLRAQQDDLEKLGGLISGNTVKAMADLGDEIDRGKVAWEGFKTQAVAGILPQLSKLVDRFVAWAVANRELISSKASAFFSAMTGALDKIATLTGFVVDHWEVFGSLFIAGGIVSAIAKGIVFVTTLQTAMATKATAAWLAILGPILLIVVTVAIVAAVIYKFRGNIISWFRSVGGFISRTWSSAWGTVKRAGHDAWEALKAGYHRFAKAVVKLPVVKQLLWLVERLRVAGRQLGLTSAADDFDVVTTAAAPAAGPPATTRPAVFGQPNGAVGPLGGRSTTTPAGPQARGAAAPAATTIANTTTVTVNAGAADAREVGRIVDAKIQESDEKNRRQLAAGLGVQL